MGAEHEDIILSWGHLYLTYNEKCLEAQEKQNRIMKFLDFWLKNLGLMKINSLGAMKNVLRIMWIGMPQLVME